MATVERQVYTHNPDGENTLKSTDTMTVPDPTMGSATIASGDSRVTVAHGLGTVPTSIQVTPSGKEAALHVDNETASSFDVVRGTLLTGDGVFYWKVE